MNWLAGRTERELISMVNQILVLSAVSWAVAQILKLFTSAVVNRKFTLKSILTGGGMPSSHSSFVCTCATGTAFLAGVDSVPFAITVVLALVVMYDAANVRKETGEQAKILNYMMENWEQNKPDLFADELKELIGHTWLQVIAGGILGILIGVIGCLIWP
jgi:hypothetical protein